MVNINNLQFKNEEAKRLADLIGIAMDLRRTLDMLAIILDLEFQKRFQQRSGMVVLDGLWSSALISYFRCFGKGVRDRLAYDSLTKEQREQHNYLKDIRDKYISHSVNALERNEVTVQVSEMDGTISEITGIGEWSERTFFKSNAANDLAALASLFLNQVEEEKKQEKPRLLKIAKELGIKHFLGMPTISADNDSTVNVRKRRDR